MHVAVAIKCAPQVKFRGATAPVPLPMTCVGHIVVPQLGVVHGK